MGFKVEKLIALLLVLCLPCAAWAETTEEFVKRHYDRGYAQARSEIEDTDRFLAEKVLPEIEAGDAAYKRNFGGNIIVSAEANDWNAIAHYLRALVEIEIEKLRRSK